MNPERPVVLLHADNFVQRGKTLKPRVHGRFQSLAADKLLRGDEVSQVIIPGGVTTPGKPPVSEVMREQILRNLAHRPEYEERVVSLGSALNTLEETREFGQMAQEHGWNNLLIISPKGQASRIKRISKKELGGSVAICTAEEVLTESPKKRILRVIANHRVSRENRWFTWKHRVLGMVEALPGGIPFIAWVSKLLPDKGATESTVPRWFK